MGILRVILAISVVLLHSAIFIQPGSNLFGFTFTGGIVSIQVFFMISGFYMTMILDKKYVGKGSYKLFLSNRFLRLYPIYWTIALLTVIGSVLSYVTFGNWWILFPYARCYDFMTLKTLLFLLFTNVAIFGQDITLFLGMNTASGNMFFTSTFLSTDPAFFTFLLVPQAWTLGLELVFYLIAPFIVRRNISIIVVIIIGSLLIRGFTYLYFGSYDPWTFRFFPSELALFLLGTISYRMYRWLQENYFCKKGQYLIAIVFYTILIYFQFLPIKNVSSFHLISWSFYLLTCLSLPIVFQLSKSSRFDNRIGELSYPIYISHFLVILSIRPFIARYEFQAYAGELSILFTIITAYILIRVVSDPIDKIRQSRVKAALSEREHR